MKSKTLSKFLALILAFALYLDLSVTPSAAAEPSINPDNPNILFIFIDDMNTVPGVYGGQAQTPNIDRLASEGMLFTNAYAAAPACNPSRIAMLTGLRPASSGITTLGPAHRKWRDYLARPDGPAYQYYGEGIDKIETIFQHLHDNGYYIASTGKTFHDNDQLAQEPWDDLRKWNFWPGIGWPENLPLHGMSEYYDNVSSDSDWGAIENAVDPDSGSTFYAESDLPDYETTQNALDILNTTPTDRPFFVGVGFLLPHLPWYVPQRMLDLYPLQSITPPETIPDDLADIPPDGVGLVWQRGGYYDQQYVFDDDYQWKNAVAHYLAGVSYVDEQVGRILNVLEDRNLAGNTIVVLWSDHGYHLGEKRHLQKHTLWEVATRAPLIIKAPGVTAAGSATDATVNGVDLFPTLVDLAGLDMPTDFHRDGRSLLPLLQNPDEHWPWPATITLGRWDRPTAERSAIRTRGWSYIRYDLNDHDPDRREELYFRITDPHEWRNLLSARNANPDDYRGVRLFLEAVLRGQILPDEPPTARDQQISVPLGLMTPIQITGDDPNLDYLVFRITSLPTAGKLYASKEGGAPAEEITEPGTLIINKPGWSANLVYEPTGGDISDRFTFSASDGRQTVDGVVDISLREETIYRLALPVVMQD